MSIQRLSNAGQSGFRYKSLIAGITPVASVPVIGEATALTSNTASVTFTAPGAYAAATFTATSSPGGFTGTSATSPITVSGLSELTAYTFTVTATNATGTSGPSAASNSITTPAAFTPEGAYDSLATVTVPSGGVASIDFAGIPTGYKHLQIRATILNTTNSGDIYMRLNSDTGSNYKAHYLYGGGSSAAAGVLTQTYIYAAFAAPTNPGVGIIDILDYANTNKYKVTRTLMGNDRNGAGDIALTSGLWLNANAITGISIFPGTASFAQYSSFALYGVK
jgi:hypothetical protein